MAWVFRVLAILVLYSTPAAAQAPQSPPKRVALVIGNAVYASANRLANPPNDARLVANALRSAGFQTVDARSDLGVQAFGRALRDFRVQANGAQVALIYYAGHGIEGSGKNWLIPVDATLATEYDLTYEAISLEQVMDALTGADLRVVILDACRDNPLGRSWTRNTRAVARGLAPVEADDVLVIYAAAPGMTAADGQGSANSPFASALARRLPEPGLAIQLLGGRVRDDVLSATSSRQRPFVSASITGEPFYLVSGASGVLPRPNAAEGSALEIAVWQSAQATNTLGAYNEYLSQYPAGRFAAFARQRIAAMSAASPIESSTRPLTPGALNTGQLIGKWRATNRCAFNIEFHTAGDTEITGVRTAFLALPGRFRWSVKQRTGTSIHVWQEDGILQFVDPNHVRYTYSGVDGLFRSKRYLCEYQRIP
jgi:uncharacterized caspase-like protein